MKYIPLLSYIKYRWTTTQQNKNGKFFKIEDFIRNLFWWEFLKIMESNITHLIFLYSEFNSQVKPIKVATG